MTIGVISECCVSVSEFVWILRSSEQVVFNNFLLIDATARSKISSDQKRFFIALSLYSLSFFANTPFKQEDLYKFGLQFSLGPLQPPIQSILGSLPPPIQSILGPLPSPIQSILGPLPPAIFLPE